MNEGERPYTAAQIGRPLGLSRQAVAQRLRSEEAVQTRFRGVRSRAWHLSRLSPNARRGFDRIARDRGYHDLASALENPQASWKPLRDASDADKTMAEQARDILAPLLQKYGERSAVSELARKAKSKFRALSLRQICRLISTAQRRAADLQDWWEWKLYLPDSFDRPGPKGRRRSLRRSSKAQRSISHAKTLGELRQSLEMLGPYPTASELNNYVWDPVFRLYRSGVSMSHLISELHGSSFFRTLKRASVRQTFRRNHEKWLKHGQEPGSLSDRRTRHDRNGWEGNGRKPLARIPDDLLPEVHKLVTQTDPNTGTKISTSMALRIFAHSDKCPQDVADVILKQRKSKHTLTPTLKRQAKITPETKMLYRGNKNFALNAFSQPRSLTWIDLNGTKRPILAGDIFEPDDMTLNQPWYVEWQPDPSEVGLESVRVAERFGVRTLRGQLLVMIDIGSQRILGFLLLARLQDSYRAEDIWSWFGQIFRDIGLPRVGIRLEGGHWRSKTILGMPIVDDTWSGERRLGGLSELGVRVIPSFSPKTKSIEILFNNLQKVLGCTGVQVGRKRGEFEQATKDYLACRAGRKHPGDCGFLHADELVKRITNACMFLNQDCREGEVYRGVPDEIWQRNVLSCGETASPAQALRPLDPAKSWIFMREKRPLTIGVPYAGMVRAKFAENDCSYYFSNPELFATLGRGYRVVACFDPAMPEQGAVIFNNEAGPRDHTNAGAGKFLGTAEFVDRVSQFSADDGFDDELGYDRRRRFTAQCRKTYRQIPLPGQRGNSATISRDARGNEVRLERGAQMPSPIPETESSREGQQMIKLARTRAEKEEEEESELQQQIHQVERLERKLVSGGEIILP